MTTENLKNIVLLLIFIQFGLMFHYSTTIYYLTSQGAISMYSFLIWVIASLSLYVAAIRLLLKRKSKGKLFLVSAIGLLICVPSLIWPYPPTYAIAFGAVLGALGWWINQRLKREITPQWLA
ncbi:hypothetical protein [Methylophilus sp. Leaf414]|uniref:hypothetical protein n=1 Tax=Methylophilus sp. Leaf414 TaxID=1736371 RepID=UPI0006FB6EAC|nr:hypothetical protein [Methylophilus sp. Leaf414]KQT38204.1 hypothetical protein ASG24_04425 [Methylophilus sp. Leaf414]